MQKTRIIINEHLDERDIVTREPVPSTELAPWRGTGPDRGQWEEMQAANDVEVEYIAPGVRAA